MAVTGKFFGFTSWQVGVGVAGAPLLVALLMLWFCGKFSAVPKEDFEQLQVKEQQVKAINAQVIIDGRYYKDQISKYKAKNLKTTNFPDYKRAK